MLNILWQQGRGVYQKVLSSKDTGGYRYFGFSPDIDLLEVKRDNTVIGYELKGQRKRGREVDTPQFYEGIDEALAYLVKPVTSPLCSSFAGSVFDYVYVVHLFGTEVGRIADLLQRLTPLGVVVVDRRRTRELVKPKPNPYLSVDLKTCFLAHLDAFGAYTTYKVNPIR